MVPVTLLPWVFGFAGLGYLAVAVVLGILFLVGAVRVYRERQGEAAERVARRLFGYSVLYLFLLFAAMLVESAAKLAPITPAWL